MNANNLAVLTCMAMGLALSCAGGRSAHEMAAMPPFSLQSFHDAPSDHGKPITALEIFRTPHSSGHALRVMTDVKPHYHESHEETVVVQSGGGVFDLGGVLHTLREGDVIVIPRKTVHSFSPGGGKPCTVLSIFTPPFDGKDRIRIAPDSQ
ncbi:MAG: cupin domain-containing protein [Gemmatimonadetes bacterium]|nr:cupin domain-containing protein [Gemmatimonadota bacterium]